MQRDNNSDSQHPIFEIIDSLRVKLDAEYRQNLSILNDIAKAVSDMSEMQTTGDNTAQGPIRDTWTHKSIRGVLHSVAATDGAGIVRNGRKVWGFGGYFGVNNVNNFGIPADDAINCSFAAEVNAIEKAMTVASEVGITFLALVTDSLQTNCILDSVFRGDAPDLGLVIDNISDDQHTMTCIRNIIKMTKNFTSVVISLIKSHTGLSDPSSRLNEHADRLAKEGALASLATTYDDDLDSLPDSTISVSDDIDRQRTISSLSDILSSPPSSNTAPLHFF